MTRPDGPESEPRLGGHVLPIPSLVEAPCQLPLTDVRPRKVWFRYLDGRYVSVAVVAVRYGSGRAIYAAAISTSRLPSGILHIRSAMLPMFRGREAGILGWADRPELGWSGSVAPTALRRYWSLDERNCPGGGRYGSWTEDGLAMTEMTRAANFGDEPWTWVVRPDEREYGLYVRGGYWSAFASTGELLCRDRSRATVVAAIRDDRRPVRPGY